MNQFPTFSWIKTIRESGVSGLPAMLATHSQFVGFDVNETRLTIEVHTSLAGYAERGGVEALRSLLRETLGDNLTIVWTSGKAAQSPALRARTKKLVQVQQVYADVMSDPFAADAIKNFGAKVILESCVSRLASVK